MDTSIVIVNWNTRDILRNCLASIYEQTKDISFEIIVIDNASSDGSVEMIKAEFPKVILIQNDKNRGFASANNQGMKIAAGRFILLLNSDTVILDDAINRTVKFADCQANAAVVGCRVLNQDGSLQQTCFMFPSLLNMLLSSTYLYKLFPRNHFFGRERMTWWDRNDVRHVDVVTGCFMLVRRQAIEQVGMMDEQFFMYGEETDWCYRFKKAGWKILFTPSAQIVHLGGASSKAVRGPMLVQLRISILKFMKKHHSRLIYHEAAFLSMLFFISRIPYWYAKALIDNTQRSQAFCRAKAYWNGVLAILNS